MANAKMDSHSRCRMYAPCLMVLLMYHANLGPIHSSNYMKTPGINPAAMKATVTCLIETNKDVTPNTGREMDFSLQVELDTDGQRGSLQVTVVIDRTLEEVACMVL